MVDLHRDGARQGPGSEQETLCALDLTRLDKDAELRVADIGCGTGASTLVLAGALPNARITAVDLFPAFLKVLSDRADAAGYSEQIEPMAKAMEALPFESESLDLMWSEGAIYSMGFEAGIEAWRPFLRPGGVLAVSEITWLRRDPPQEVLDHWNAEYPEIATAAQKISALERMGFDLLGYFSLRPSSWIDGYYKPTEERTPPFLQRHAGRPEATEIVEMQRHEADLYQRFQEWFSYGFYVARKR